MLHVLDLRGNRLDVESIKQLKAALRSALAHAPCDAAAVAHDAALLCWVTDSSHGGRRGMPATAMHEELVA